MRLIQLYALASLALVAGSQLVVLTAQERKLDSGHTNQRLLPASGEAIQQPIALPAMPPGTAPGGAPGSGGQPSPGTVILSDVMGRDRSINVFAGFTRDFAGVTSRFDDATQNSTVLAPLNSAINALPRKPWEDPGDYKRLGADAYEGGGGQERAQDNLRRFVEAHIVPVSPWPEHHKIKTVAGDGGDVWWEMKNGVRVIQPDNIEVVSVASTVANGQVWIIKGVRNYLS